MLRCRASRRTLASAGGYLACGRLGQLAQRGGTMRYRQAAIIGALAAFGLATGACNRDVAQSRNANAEVSRDADRAADLQRQRDQEISRLDQRVADVERKYAEANQKVVSGSRTA